MTVNNAAGNYLSYIARLYDTHYPKTPIPPLLGNQADDNRQPQIKIDNQEKIAIEQDSPLFQKIVEYNNCPTMVEWYNQADPTSRLRDIYSNGVFNPRLAGERLFEGKAIEYSALCHLTAIGETVESIVPVNFGKMMGDNPILPPLLNIISPKAQLDNRVFAKAYDKATLTERTEIIRLMEVACANVNPSDLARDRLIYKIQGIVVYVFETPLTKGLLFAGLVCVTYLSYEGILTRVTHCFFAVIVPQCNVLIDLRAPLVISQAYHKLFDTAVTVNAYLMSPSKDIPEFLGKCLIKISIPLAIRFTGPVLPVLSTGIKACYYMVFPRYLIWAYASPYIYRPALLAYKILSGVEYQTIWAIQDKFKDDPMACEQALKAHALFLRIMQKGTPEDAMILTHYLPWPSPTA